ncbi:MAG: MazF family transcriptional regulator [Gammaproteobacteria bacterium]|nr:MazF family transcriptional regulator [Gammaproteobacteria bacterium]
MKTEIKQWGNSAAVRLSSKTLAAANLKISSAISIAVKGRKIVIEPVDENVSKRLKLPFNEAVLLEGLTPKGAHADELAAITAIEIGE